MTKNNIFLKIFKDNFRLIVFTLCISAVLGLVFFQVKAFTFQNYAPNLLAEITGMFLGNIFTLLIIDQYYRIQKEKEYTQTLEELRLKLNSLFNTYRKHCAEVFEIENNLNNKDFFKKILNKINLIQQENTDLSPKFEKFEFINSLEEMGNIIHSIVHILSILPGEFEIKDFLVSFEKIKTTLLLLKRHIAHSAQINHQVFINDLKFLTEELLNILTNKNFKEI